MTITLLRRDADGWYSKQGTSPGIFVDQEYVESEKWVSINSNGSHNSDNYYDDKTIYFAVKIGWDE